MADVLIVESDAEIKAQDGSSVRALRYVNGLKSGDLQYYASNPPYGTTEDTAFTWTVNAPGSGYWVRVSNYASPLFWGAVVGGTQSTNRTAVQAAFDFCVGNAMELRFDWDGTLNVNDELTISGPFNITGAGRTRTILRQTGAGEHLIRIADTVTDAAWRSFGLSCDADAGHVLCMGAISSYAIFSINTGSSQFTVTGIGASTVIAVNDAIRVRGGGTNDRTYTVSAITTSGGNTVITVLETIASSTVGTSFVEWMAAERFTRNLLEDIQFQQQNTANSIVYGIWNNAGGFTLNRFDHVKLMAEAGHNCPLIDVASNGNWVQSDVFSDVWAFFERSTAQAPNDVAGLDYIVRFACHAAGTFFDQLTFDKWLVEQADGGVIHLIGCNHSTIRNVQMFDNGPRVSGGAQITKHLIKLESNADPDTPQASRMNLLEMIVRHTGALNSGIYDIWIDTSTDGTVLVACQGTASDPLEIQFNSNPAAMVGDKYQQLYNAGSVNTLASS